MENVFIFDHPLIQHKISLLRDKNTDTKEFRELVSEIAMLMGYEVTRNMPLKEVEIETPVGIAKTNVIYKDRIFCTAQKAEIDADNNYFYKVNKDQYTEYDGFNNDYIVI